MVAAVIASDDDSEADDLQALVGVLLTWVHGDVAMDSDSDMDDAEPDGPMVNYYKFACWGCSCPASRRSGRGCHPAPRVARRRPTRRGACRRRASCERLGWPTSVIITACV